MHERNWICDVTVNQCSSRRSGMTRSDLRQKLSTEPQHWGLTVDKSDVFWTHPQEWSCSRPPCQSPVLAAMSPANHEAVNVAHSGSAGALQSRLLRWQWRVRSEPTVHGESLKILLPFYKSNSLVIRLVPTTGCKVRSFFAIYMCCFANSMMWTKVVRWQLSGGHLSSYKNRRK
jgi:hypothetical protein